MAPETENELLENVALTRRSFVRKAVLGSAFAFPVVASFDMRSVQAGTPDCLTPNQTGSQSDDIYKLKIIGTKRKGKIFDLRIRVSDSETGQNLSRKGRKVRVKSVSPKPKHVGLKLPKDYEFVNNESRGRHYRLKLDVKDWPEGYYSLHTVIEGDPFEFTVGIFVGPCPT